VFNDIETLARARFDPAYVAPQPESFAFGGLSWPYDEADVFELWLQWEEHGVMPEPGGYFDQPPEWREAIHWCRRMFGFFRYEVEKEVAARKPPANA
jgi:hypothetical protein